MLRQVKQTPVLEANIVIIIFLLGFDLLSLSYVNDFYNFSPSLSALGLSTMAYGSLAFSSIALAVMVIMEKATSKKMRTLLRLPIIGALVGFYLKDERILYLFVAIELLLTLYFFAKRDLYNYAFRQQIKALIGLILFVTLVINGLSPYSLFGLIIFILMKNQIINQIKLKLVLEKSQNDI
jgi:hypothetical protein